MMQEKHIYEYALIRVMPKVERGECMNVGIILFSKKKQYLDIKYHLDEKRLLAFSPDVDVKELADYLSSWDLICKGSPEGGRIAELGLPERFRWLTATRSTIIQSSKVHPGLCSDLETLLDRLFQEYVL